MFVSSVYSEAELIHPDFTRQTYTDGVNTGPALYCKTPNEFVCVQGEDVTVEVVGTTSPKRVNGCHIHIRDMLDDVIETRMPLCVRVCNGHGQVYTFFICSPM
jgi:hypothetical protein